MVTRAAAPPVTDTNAPAQGPLFRPADFARPEWSNALATARAFLRQPGRRLHPGGAFQPDTDLVAQRAERDALGMTHLRFTQT